MLPKRRKPTHPGQVIEEDFLKPMAMTARQFAEKLGGNWTEIHIEAILKGKENLSEKAATQFATALGTSPEFLIHLQHLYTSWEQQHRRNQKGSLKPLKKAQ